MAKNYTKENYAVNKFSKGIVYRGAEGDYEITLDDFLQKNPDKSKEDFEYWKKISDELYKEEDLMITATTRKNVSINEIEETQIVAVESAESAFFSKEDGSSLTRSDIVNKEYICQVAKKVLTQTQYTRFIAYYVEGNTLVDIADAEGVNHTSVSRAISASEKKIKEYLKKICTKNSIFDVI